MMSEADQIETLALADQKINEFLGGLLREARDECLRKGLSNDLAEAIVLAYGRRLYADRERVLGDLRRQLAAGDDCPTGRLQ